MRRKKSEYKAILKGLLKANEELSKACDYVFDAALDDREKFNAIIARLGQSSLVVNYYAALSIKHAAELKCLLIYGPGSASEYEAWLRRDSNFYGEF